MSKLSNWRYVPHTDGLLDRLTLYNPEDDIIDRIDGVQEDKQYTEELHKAIELLPEIEKETIWKHIFEGKSFSTIGEERLMSKQAVHQVYQKSIKKLKEILNDK
jgi:RNA polymerase sigma factor (sigma-70 family)